MVDSTTYCLKELKEDSKTSTGFKRMYRCVQALIRFYSSEQQVAFEGKTAVSMLDIDRQGTELESKVIRGVLFSQFRLSYVPQVLSIQPFQVLLLYIASL